MLGKKILFWGLMLVVMLFAGLAVTAQDRFAGQNNQYAYPVPNMNVDGQRGMSLREYYAGQALQALAVKEGDPDTITRKAWSYADWMLYNKR